MWNLALSLKQEAAVCTFWEWKERREALLKLCIVAGSIFATEKWQLRGFAWYNALIKQNNLLKFTTRAKFSKKNPKKLAAVASKAAMPVRPDWRNQTGTIASLKCQMMLSCLSQPRAVYSRCSWDCFETNVGWIPDYSLAGPGSGWGTPAWQHVIMETDCSCFDKYVNGTESVLGSDGGTKGCCAEGLSSRWVFECYWIN